MGSWGRRTALTQEAEAAMSQDRATALQPGRQEQDSISKSEKVNGQNSSGFLKLSVLVSKQ